MPRKKKEAQPQVKKFSSKKLWVVLAVILLIFLVILVKTGHKRSSYKMSGSQKTSSFDLGNSTITLNNEQISFYNGLHKSINNSYGQHKAEISGKNMSPDGTRFAAILTDSPGGSGTFYYLIGGMLKNGKEIYSKPILLGDRINIESVEVSDPGREDNGLIEVKYLDRPAGAPMAAEPTVESLSKFGFDGNGNLTNILY